MENMYSRHGRAKAGVKNSLAAFVHAKKIKSLVHAKRMKSLVHAKKMKSLIHAKKIKFHSKGGHPTSKNP